MRPATRNGTATGRSYSRFAHRIARRMNAIPPRRIEFRLTVWCDPGTRWRACVRLDDGSEVEFRSPFELARFLSWPPPLRSPVATGGLR